MPNLTVSLDESVLRAVKVYAATRGTSISKIVRDHLAEVTGLSAKPATTDDPLLRYSRDEIGRKEAMKQLKVDYGTLIEMMADRGLPLPELPQRETETMAAVFERIMRSVE